MLLLPFYFSESLEPKSWGCRNLLVLQIYSFPQLSFSFIPYPSSLLFLLLFIPLHRTLQGLKEGFSWHGVSSDSEGSNLESNQGGLGAWEHLQSKRKSLTPSLPISSSCILLGSCRIPTHSSCLSIFKK